MKNYRAIGFILIAAVMSLELVAQPVQQPGAKQGEPAVEQNAQSTAGSHYVIGDGDVLQINVWNEPAFDHSIPVRSDGRISLPLIGSIQAAGRTPSELENDIADKLRKYMTRPEVTVMVLQIKSRDFNILGRVAKPGAYPLLSKTTVIDAIAEAGGFVEFAKQKDIYVLRKDAQGKDIRLKFNYKKYIKGEDTKQNIVLKPHDTIIVP
jgi:polysaccharide export outer membrane protein